MKDVEALETIKASPTRELHMSVHWDGMHDTSWCRNGILYLRSLLAPTIRHPLISAPVASRIARDPANRPPQNIEEVTPACRPSSLHCAALQTDTCEVHSYRCTRIGSMKR